jgi:hypothetical protein
MSRYVFQYFVLLIAALLFTSWQRRNRGKPAPIRNGFHVVRWPLTLRLIAGAFFIMVLTIELSLIWAKFTTDENIPGVIRVLAIPLLAPSSYAPLAWRARTEYNETNLIAYPMMGHPRQYAVSDFTRAGPVSWRGHEFSTETGEKIFVNSYQTGGPTLIELLQGRVRVTDYE